MYVWSECYTLSSIPSLTIFQDPCRRALSRVKVRFRFLGFGSWVAGYRIQLGLGLQDTELQDTELQDTVGARVSSRDVVVRV